MCLCTGWRIPHNKCSMNIACICWFVRISIEFNQIAENKIHSHTMEIGTHQYGNNHLRAIVCELFECLLVGFDYLFCMEIGFLFRLTREQKKNTSFNWIFVCSNESVFNVIAMSYQEIDTNSIRNLMPLKCEILFTYEMETTGLAWICHFSKVNKYPKNCSKCIQFPMH